MRSTYTRTNQQRQYPVWLHPLVKIDSGTIHSSSIFLHVGLPATSFASFWACLHLVMNLIILNGVRPFLPGLVL